MFANNFFKNLKPVFNNKYFLAFFAGAFMALSFAPFYVFIAPAISLSVFYFLLEKNYPKKRQIFYLGFAFGYGHFLFTIYWISISLLVDAASFAWLIPFALTLIPGLLAAYFGLFALGYKFLLKRFNFKETYQKIIVFALCFFVMEFLRSNLFSGFPWALLGYVWIFNLKFAQISSIFGIYGLSILAVLCSLIPVIFYKKTASFSDKIFTIILTLFLIGNFTFGHFYINDKKLTKHDDIKIRLIQANVAQELKWNGEERFRNFIKHIAMTNSQNPAGLKAVIWSESSIPYVLNQSPELFPYIEAGVPENGVVISGGLRIKENNKVGEIDVYNSIFVLNKAGINNYYDKHHLVPFGEYVPLHQFLSFLFLDKIVDGITGGGKGFSEGEGAQTLALEDFSFSPLVCYEAIFSDQVIDKNNLPDVFINLTNDAWFGNSSGPFQHFDMARMRAIEYGIPLIRVANNGITAFVDPFGRIIKSLPRNQMAIADITLIKNTQNTIYTIFGNLPTAFLVIILLSILLFKTRKKNAKTHHTN